MPNHVVKKLILSNEKNIFLFGKGLHVSDKYTSVTRLTTHGTNIILHHRHRNNHLKKVRGIESKNLRDPL